MSDTPPPSPVRKLDPHRPLRRRCELPAKLSFENGRVITGRVIDLSGSGTFLETREEAQWGDRGTMEIQLTPAEVWAAACIVVRLGLSQREVRDARVEAMTVSSRGIGVQFDRLDPLDRERLRAFLESLDVPT